MRPFSINKPYHFWIFQNRTGIRKAYESFGYCSRKDLGLISGENSLSCDLGGVDKGLSNLKTGTKRKRDMRQNTTCIIA